MKPRLISFSPGPSLTLPNEKQEGMAASAAMEAFVGRRFEEALHHFSRAIILNPLNHTYFTNRSSVYAHLGNVNAAFADAESAVSLRPDRPTVRSKKKKKKKKKRKRTKRETGLLVQGMGTEEDGKSTRSSSGV